MDIVLVHRSYHGAWCWDLLTPELEALGHRAVAVELPITDSTAAGEAYADVVVDALRDTADPILVGHSMAGLVIPIAAARHPVRRLVFLAAMLPIPGMSMNDQRAREPVDGLIPPVTAEWTALGDDVWMVGPATATELFFHDAPPATVAWATARLRPQSYRVMNEPTPLEAWPSVPVTSIVCRDDHALNPEWGRTAARNRLGVEALEIGGSHSPFLTRPGELAAMLDEIASG
jgi:pimeloyl-ACP methyl ester carboxylesterase